MCALRLLSKDSLQASIPAILFPICLTECIRQKIKLSLGSSATKFKLIKLEDSSILHIPPQNSGPFP